jgi:hypothetical protein
MTASSMGGLEGILQPYPGLRPFRETESAIFFGREQQTDELLNKLQRQRFIAVTGPSGCGKSSLIRAGVIPALRAGFMLAAGSRWRVCSIRPGQHPIASLARALATPEVLGDDHEAPPFLDAALQFGPLGLVQIVRESPLFHDSSLLVLVDQFEEIFRFRSQNDPDETDAFVGLLLASIAIPEVPIYVVITMRSDYLGDCALFHGLPEAINGSQYLTPRLTREQCSGAITGPARVCGGDVDSSLVNRLLNDFGPDPDQLPLLQHALMRMWTREQAEIANGRPRRAFTIDDYIAVGGLSKALTTHAEEVLAEVPALRKPLAEALFRRLTERGIGGRDTRAPARLAEVAAVSAASLPDVIQVVNVFRGEGRNFITPAEGDLAPDTLLDIGHESLIRQWATLATWVDAETESATVYKRLVDTAHLWQKKAAALWRPPDLTVALAWQERECPNDAWASRYAPAADFDLAMEFISESRAAWEVEQLRETKRQEEERGREVERIEHDAERARLEALARAAKAEAELERAKAIAQRQTRRNRALHVATVLLSLGVVGLLGVIFGYRYLRVWPHTELYKDYAKVRGVPNGIGKPLNAAQAKRREFNYKITRRGMRGPVVSMEAVDASDRLLTEASVGNAAGYLGDSGDTEQRRSTVRWEYMYGNDGEIAYELELDKRGRQVASMVYMPAGGNKNVRTAHFFGAGGEAMTALSCADYVQVEFTPKGYEGKVRYLDRSGRLVPGRDHAVQLEQHFDRNGNLTSMISLDTNGRRMNDRYGNAIMEATYDDDGNLVDDRLLDERGAPVNASDGWARKKIRYDLYGNRVETLMFDAENRPTLQKEGWHRAVENRDANGNVESETFWGIKGEPVSPVGCHEYRMDRDDRGRPRSTRCLGANGQSANEVTLGVPEWRTTYDQYDNAIEIANFDEHGAPAITTSGYHKLVRKYDDRGNIIEYRYLDKDERLTEQIYGYASVVKEFEGDREVRRQYLDAAGKPVLNTSGYAEERWIYDANGNLFEDEYFDTFHRPVALAGGDAAHRYTKYECGQVTEEWYVGTNQQPVDFFGEYAGVRTVYDRLGRISKQMYIAANGAPVLLKNQKIAGFEQDLDAQGRRTEIRYLGADGQLTPHKNGYAIARTTYDDRGNVTSQGYYDRNRKMPAALGYIRLAYSYDDDNKAIRTTYYGPTEDVVLGTVESSYNAQRQLAAEAYYDSDHRPLVRNMTEGLCASRRFTYDADGKPRVQCLDLSGNPATKSK